MPLNLGNLTNEYSNMSTEELLLEAANAEIELTEMLHSMENLENARKIQDLAKQSGSAECMNFAEELLGCSMEVDLSSIDVGGYKKFHSMAETLISRLDDIVREQRGKERFVDFDKLCTISKPMAILKRNIVKKMKQFKQKYYNIIVGNTTLVELADKASAQKVDLRVILRCSRFIANTGKADAAIGEIKHISIC